MGSMGDPKTWLPLPYFNTKDCSLGFCSLYCLQWCYVIQPPPPPSFEFPEDGSSSSLSPLIIAIIGILTTALLLVTYFVFISKFCSKDRDSATRVENPGREAEFDRDFWDPTRNELWFISNDGLDEAVIRSIAVWKYKKGGGLVSCTDCSVCLGEFEEDERLRLLPKCAHAFHVSCIDTWLRSHSNCPLCRAGIIFHAETLSRENSNPLIGGNAETGGGEMVVLRVGEGTSEAEIREEEEEEEEDRLQIIRRSVSMDYSCRPRDSVVGVLFADKQEEIAEEEEDGCRFRGCNDPQSSLKPCSAKASGKSRSRNRVLNSVTVDPATVRRSFSSGRLYFKRKGRKRRGVLPL